ncbi:MULTISPECIES: PHB depolymerase family esterase [unclassified Yoonia]|uniref:extracellular catalytic domain type 1 short-chain-length polyhydroxyalkanoate depolymerase n=1 Tax=unclassified Yoonia TaxID=2629118 RepID=UPI002AFF72A2|nr:MULTISPECIES: PHB depolymerase family esterase [unclassified Yoonia]
MTTPFARGMARATELTRAGKLTEATELIQSIMQGQAASQDVTADQDMIEGDFVALDDTGTVKPKAAEKKAEPPAKPKPAPRKRRATGLRETLHGLKTGGLAGHNIRHSAEPELPEGAEFLTLTHTSMHGSRDYRLYVPAKQPSGTMPLVVMLHGCTQSPEDFAIGTGMNAVAEEFGCLVAYPAQTQAANAQKCWNWFHPEDQGRDRGEPALIAGIVSDILRDRSADADRVYVAGLSAGGAAAAIMGDAYPDVFAGVGVHSGLPVGSAKDMGSAFTAMRSGAAGLKRTGSIPTIVFHGMADRTVHPANGAAVAAQVIPGGLRKQQSKSVRGDGRSYKRISHSDDAGRSMVEHWEIDGTGHAWAGGQSGGSYTDPTGPDASREMLRFFLQHKRVLKATKKHR